MLEVKERRLYSLNADDLSCSFRINIDVLNEAFGLNRSMYCRAMYPENQNKAFKEADGGNKEFVIWMPKMFSNSSEWKNSISDDGEYIFEDAELTRHEDWTDTLELEKKYRLVFIKDSNDSPYRFVGVFKNETMDFLHHSYKKVASIVDLIGDPVHSIRIVK